MNNSESRGPWYLFTGLALGLAIGLAYAWNFQPVRYIDTAPVFLRANFKDEYRALVSVAFMASGNIVRAEERLSLLQDPDPISILALQAGRWPLEGRPGSESQGLAALAATLLENAARTAVPTGFDPELVTTQTASFAEAATPPPTVLATPSPTTGLGIAAPTSQATPTVLPTRTPTATPGGAFALDEQSLLCDTDPGKPLIVFDILDAGGSPVPGIEISVTWASGEERFFTGLKPEFGLGYADFTMTPGERYTILLQPAKASGSQPLTGLQATECEQNGKRFWGVWKLTYAQR
jgi:hypothetical protein